MRFYTRPRRIPMVNIVSLIDILCIVLIFFVVTSTFKKNEPKVKIDLPESHQARPAVEAPPVIISVTKSGDVYLESTEIPVDSLAERMKEKMAENPSVKFALKISKEAPFGVFVKISDANKDVGFDSTSYYTDDTPVPPANPPNSPNSTPSPTP